MVFLSPSAKIGLALLVLLCGAGCSVLSQRDQPVQEIRIIPDELYRYAEDRGCNQVSDFYVDHPDMVEPPFVYSVLATRDEDAHNDTSAAFWCEPDGGANGVTLLIKLDGRQWPGGCLDRIEYQSDIGGLSIIRMLDEPLSIYRPTRTTDAVPTVPTDARTDGPGIQSEYDGFGFMYYCYRGQWLSRPLDW
jgi:hypothetical protein